MAQEVKTPHGGRYLASSSGFIFKSVKVLCLMQVTKNPIQTGLIPKEGRPGDREKERGMERDRAERQKRRDYWLL